MRAQLALAGLLAVAVAAATNVAQAQNRETGATVEDQFKLPVPVVEPLPRAFKTAEEHYNFLLERAHGGTKHTMATIPVWDGLWGSGNNTMPAIFLENGSLANAWRPGATKVKEGVLTPPYELPDDEMLQLFTTRLAANDAAEGQKLLALYKRRHPETRNRMLWLMADSDDTRRWNAQLLCRLKYEQGTAPSYLYFFNWQSPVHNNRMGSYHTLDIPFVFYNMDIGASMTGSRQSRYELGHVMSAAWAAFARTGNPNHADMPNWPSFEPNNLPTMVFGETVAVVNDPNKEERLALAALRAKRPS